MLKNKVFLNEIKRQTGENIKNDHYAISMILAEEFDESRV